MPAVRVMISGLAISGFSHCGNTVQARAQNGLRFVSGHGFKAGRYEILSFVKQEVTKSESTRVRSSH